MPFHDTDTKTFEASEAIADNVIVKLDSAGTVSVADVSEAGIGVAQNPAYASGDDVAVRLFNKGGTIEMLADAAITLGATVYGRDGGEIDDSSADSAVAVGTALEAASGAGALIEVLIS
jgi:hypothetical protein